MLMIRVDLDFDPPVFYHIVIAALAASDGVYIGGVIHTYIVFE